MKFYCDECDLKVQEYVDWTIHLVSPGHQSNVEMKVDEWVAQQNPKCLVIIANPLEIQFSVCDVVATLLSYGTLLEICIHLLEDDRSLYVVEYELSDSADYALSNLAKNKSWKIDSVQKLTELRLLDWALLLPDHAFTEVQEARERRNSASMPQPPEKIRRLEQSCFIFSKDCAAKRAFQDTTSTGLEEQNRSALRAELSKILPSIYAAQRHDANGVPSPTSPVSVKTEKMSPPPDPDDLVSEDVPVMTPNQRQGLQKEKSRRTGDAEQYKGRREPERVYRKHSQSSSNSSTPKRKRPTKPTRSAHKPLKEEPVEKKPVLFSPRTEYSSARGRLDNEIKEFYNASALSLDDLQNIKEVVIKDLENILRTRFPNCKLDLFDTIVAGRCNLVEIHVCGLDEIDYEKKWINNKKDRQGLEARESSRITRDMFHLLRRTMKNVAAKQRNFRKLKMQLDGYMSNLTFTHKASPKHKLMLACCISRPQITRRQDFRLIEFYIKVNPRVRELLCCIQYWADIHGFIGFSKMKDYLLSVLVIVMLTKQRVLPSLSTIQFFCEKYVNTKKLNWLIEFCDSEELTNGIANTIRSDFIYSRNANFSLLEMLREFFVMYGDHKITQRVIATWTSQLLTQKGFYQGHVGANLDEYKRELKLTGKRFRIGSTISIQDPFELTFNLGSTIPIPLFKDFQRKCIQSAVIVNRLLKNRAPVTQEANDLTFQCLFDPTTPSCPPPPNLMSEVLPPCTPKTVNTKTGSVFQDMSARFQSKLAALNIAAPIPDDFIKYAQFTMEPEFYGTFETHMRNVDSRAVPSQVKLQSCRLWSTFAMHFIRNIWAYAFGMDAQENTLILNMIGHGGSHGRYEVMEPDPSFPVGYNLYYGLIDCKGFIGQTTSTRTKIKNSRLASLNYSHPFDLEWEITRFSKSLKSNREIGNVTWRLECEVMYEDLPTPDSVRNPTIMFVLHGVDRDILQYIWETIRTTFQIYQMHLLQLWFDHKEEFASGTEDLDSLLPIPSTPTTSPSSKNSDWCSAQDQKSDKDLSSSLGTSGEELRLVRTPSSSEHGDADGGSGERKTKTNGDESHESQSTMSTNSFPGSPSYSASNSSSYSSNSDYSTD